MKIKTSEATPLQLNWLVATCEGIDNFDCMGVAYVADPDQPHFNKVFRPSTDWSHGGKIIEREGIELRVHVTHNNVITSWAAEKDWPMNVTAGATGPTPLIAVMRCFISSKLGDIVDVPDELLGD